MSGAQYRVCFKCKWEGETAEKNCPRCHEMLYTRGYIQASGVILTAIGAGLVVVMSVISLLAAYAIRQSGTPGGRFKYTGTRQDMVMIFAIFGVVMLFGLASLTEGLWQLIYGRRNRVLVYIILTMGFLFIIAGSFFGGD